MLKSRTLATLVFPILLIGLAVEAFEIITPDHEVTIDKYATVSVHLVSDPTFEGTTVTFGVRKDHVAQNLDIGLFYANGQDTCDSYGSARFTFDPPTLGWPSDEHNTTPLHLDAIAHVAGTKYIDVQNINVATSPY